MKIVKEGKWGTKWEKEFTCTNQACEAVILVEECDLKPTENKADDNYFNCAACGKRNFVDIETLLPRIIEDLNKRRKYDSSEL